MPPHVRGGALCDDHLVQAVTRQVLSLSRRRHVDGALEVGRLVLEAFFGSDYATFRRRHRRHASYKRFLKALPDHGVSRTYLHVSMHLRPQVEELGPQRARQLTLSHHAELLSLEGEEKVLLADEIIARGLSVKQVRARKRALPRSNRLGRPPALPDERFLRMVRRLPKVVAPTLELAAGTPDLASALSPAERQTARTVLEDTATDLHALARRLAETAARD